jgi:hypothetical protein
VNWLRVLGVLLQKSKSAIFDACNPLKYRDMILDKNVKNWFLQQNPVYAALRVIKALEAFLFMPSLYAPVNC